MNEEKKLTDEVVVAKNAITDEEIAKAILQQIEYNAGIPYIDEWLKVKTIKFTDILNFIHRLQAENKELKSPKFASWKLKFFNLKEEFDKELAEHEAFAKKAKAEIERLTEEKNESAKTAVEVLEQNIELQKQVQQAIKDTAREICDLILEHWEKKQFVECDWLRVAISEKVRRGGGMMMQGETFRGDVKDVCAELKEELKRCGNISVDAWLRLRKIEDAEAEQFGMSVEDFRKNLKKY